MKRASTVDFRAALYGVTPIATPGCTRPTDLNAALFGRPSRVADTCNCPSCQKRREEQKR